MLLRLLLLRLCRTQSELRVLWRVIQRYRSLPPEDRVQYRLTDKRIKRSIRLSLAWAIWKVQLDTPHIVAIGLVGMGGLIAQGVIFVVKHIAKWVH